MARCASREQAANKPLLQTVFQVCVVSLSPSSCLTHNKAMCMHLSTSLAMKDFTSARSINSKHFPAHHMLQACMDVTVINM